MTLFERIVITVLAAVVYIVAAGWLVAVLSERPAKPRRKRTKS